MDLIDIEIQNASEAIDKALLRIDKTNRGEISVQILKCVRDLNDNIAYKIMKDLRPDKEYHIKSVAGNFASETQYYFIYKFHKYLSKYLSHHTPNEDNGERLMIKYYQYISQLKKVMKDRYNFDIVKNLEKFLLDLDEQTLDYYTKVSTRINEIKYDEKNEKGFDNYYIDKIKPFFINGRIYYEVALEPAEEKVNKFGRITAFTKFDMLANYSVALKFEEKTIQVFGVNFPIKIITNWKVSIRPCEFINFGRIFNQEVNIQRVHNDYKYLMKFLTDRRINLIDLINLKDEYYERVKNEIVNTTKDKKSKIFDLLDECKKMKKQGIEGINIISYLLCRMNNRIIKLQINPRDNRRMKNLNLCRGCLGFESKPFSFNPKGHIAKLSDVFESIDLNGHQEELLARYIKESAEVYDCLFVPIDSLIQFGDETKIKEYIDKYNRTLDPSYKPNAELAIYKNFVYIKEYVVNAGQIIKKLLYLSQNKSMYSSLFTKNRIEELKILKDEKNKLDDPDKQKILNSIFKNSQVHFIYGAAGTGKTTLINHISNLMDDKIKLFLAKTYPAVQNLRNKIKTKNDKCHFTTIDKYLNNNVLKSIEWDLIVVDECSIVENKQIIEILNTVKDSALVLSGDTYQIEAIGYGAWFNMAQKAMPSYCCSELTVPYRATGTELVKLWKEVREMNDENTVLEELVQNYYSSPINRDILKKKSKDEIILCLNYNGLYGLNNINRLMQLGNENKGVDIDVWKFKIDDPILFNDSERFKPLYNNLKGRILDIKDYEFCVEFIIKVETILKHSDLYLYKGIELLKICEDYSIVQISVDRRQPYASDYDSGGDGHIVPFQVAYAVSIHKSQGLEYESVKVVISDEIEDRVNHNIFYTAITRSKQHLTLYWSPEVCNHILENIRPKDKGKEYFLLKNICKL